MGLYSLTHSHTHSLTHPLTHPFTHTLTHSLTHPRTHSPTHCDIYTNLESVGELEVHHVKGVIILPQNWVNGLPHVASLRDLHDLGELVGKVHLEYVPLVGLQDVQMLWMVGGGGGEREGGGGGERERGRRRGEREGEEE